MLFYDCEVSAIERLMLGRSNRAKLTVLQRNVDTPKIYVFAKIVLCYVRNHAPRSVAEECRGRDWASCWQRQTTKAGCKGSCCLEDGEIEHFGWELGEFIASIVRPD